LRDGRQVETFAVLGGRRAATLLVQRMVGRSITDVFGYRPREHGETALEVTGICGAALAAPASFAIKRREIILGSSAWSAPGAAN
jgi:L-arabinose transport system ATP-binding protein